MLVTIQVELSEAEYKRLCSNSLERVLNLASLVADYSKHADRYTAIDDIQELKPIATRLWVAAHNAVFAQLNPQH